MSEKIYLLTIGLPLLTVLFVFAMRYGSAAFQARARLAKDNAYRAIAEKAVATQSESAAALSLIRTDLVEIKTRLAAVEKVLKEVQ